MTVSPRAKRALRRALASLAAKQDLLAPSPLMDDPRPGIYPDLTSRRLLGDSYVVCGSCLNRLIGMAAVALAGVCTVRTPPGPRPGSGLADRHRIAPPTVLGRGKDKGAEEL